jgi:hypothetical protein
MGKVSTAVVKVARHPSRGTQEALCSASAEETRSS